VKRPALLLSGLVLFIATVQCRHRVDYPSTQVVHNEKANESLEVRAEWMKYKELKVDMMLRLRNDYKHTLVLKNENFKVEMDGDRAYLRSPRPATFELEPGESIGREMTFRFDRERDRRGPVKLMITNIHSGTIEKPGKELKPVVMELPLR